MATIQISSSNYNGQTAQITFYAASDPSTPVDLGSHSIPYSRTDNNIDGSYELYFSGYNKTCTVAWPIPAALRILTEANENLKTETNDYLTE